MTLEERLEIKNAIEIICHCIEAMARERPSLNFTDDMFILRDIAARLAKSPGALRAQGHKLRLVGKDGAS